MKINNYAVSLQSKHTLTQTYSRSESQKVVGNLPKALARGLGIQANNGNGSNAARQLAHDAREDYLELSKEAARKMQEAITGKSELSMDDIQKLDIPDKDKQKLLLIAKMIKTLTGKDIKIVLPKDIKFNSPDIKLKFSPVEASQLRQAAHDVNWAVQYKSSETYSESESLSFSAKGVVNTSGGKQIDFSLDLNMSRSFAYQNDVDITMGNKKLLDPLVINYDGPAAGVTQTKFQFDIDSDGNADQLSTLTKGTGFLALDKNNDGTINDGNELFGTKSGNGFADLASYDTDKNNWIDENDAIFDKLRIWSVNEDGSKELFSLGEKGIGAIYLGNVSAAFSMDNAQNETQAQAKSAGIFLRENGTAGTVQQIDYLV